MRQHLLLIIIAFEVDKMHWNRSFSPVVLVKELFSFN
jgi:hypothetical protein